MMEITGAQKLTIVRASDLGRDDPGRKIRRALRMMHKNGGVHFRHQVHFRPYIGYTCDRLRKLVVEVHGGQHGRFDGPARDAEASAQSSASVQPSGATL